MSEQNKVNEEIIEVPLTEVEQENPNDTLNLEDVGFMVVVGRRKDGETFFKTVGINDLIVVRGLVEYARDEVKFQFNKYFENKSK
jgi:hypothetical protein